MKIICSRCKVVIVGRNEQAVEIKFGEHKCANKRNFREMSDELIKQLACREITEEQAWAIHDGK